MLKSIKTAFFSLIIASLLMLPLLVSAQTSQSPKNRGLIEFTTDIAKKGGFQTETSIASVPKIAGLIIGAFLGFLGLIFIVLMILAGFKWMTANGNDEEVKKAKATIKQSLIGLVIAISGYTIWNFVFTKLIQ